MRILFTGGGTGGHIYPILAVFRSLKHRLGNDTEYYFIGPKTAGIETLTQEGIRVITIVAGKIPRYITPRLFIEFVKIPFGIAWAIIALWRIMPDVVFGKGGFGMVPVVLAARLFTIPIVIHESDSVPGLSTKIAARFANTITTSFQETAAWFPGSRVTGNPVRTTMRQGSRSRAQARWHIALGEVLLVLGGSQGAWQLNDTILKTAPGLLSKTEIILQCGTKTHGAVRERFERIMRDIPNLAPLLHIEAFLDEQELADAYAIASLVVSRAGSSTLFENALAAKPMLLIPLASAAANHQEANADVFVRSGAAELLSRENLAPHLFSEKIISLLANKQKRDAMAGIAKTLARPDAADAVATIIIEHLAKHDEPNAS